MNIIKDHELVGISGGRSRKIFKRILEDIHFFRHRSLAPAPGGSLGAPGGSLGAPGGSLGAPGGSLGGTLSPVPIDGGTTTLPPLISGEGGIGGNSSSSGSD